jgi:hypothetical protein
MDIQMKYAIWKNCRYVAEGKKFEAYHNLIYLAEITEMSKVLIY